MTNEKIKQYHNDYERQDEPPQNCSKCKKFTNKTYGDKSIFDRCIECYIPDYFDLYVDWQIRKVLDDNENIVMKNYRVISKQEYTRLKEIEAMYEGLCK